MLEKIRHALDESGAGKVCPVFVRVGECLTDFGIPDNRVLELGSVFLGKAPNCARKRAARSTWNMRVASDKSGQASTTRAPAASIFAAMARTTSRISGCTGKTPKSSVTATLRLRNSTGVTRRNVSPGSINTPALRSCGPAITEKSSAVSSTLRPIGPGVDRSLQAGRVDSNGTRPGDGRKPTTLQNAAGLRRDPPVSLPSAMGMKRAASATAAPPLLPPQVRETS